MEPIVVSIPGKKSPQEQKQEALLASCKYYKGENVNPFLGKDQNKMMFWDYERIWVMRGLDGDSFSDELKQMEDAGLGGFGNQHAVQDSLVALLYNRFDHWLEGTPDDFKAWFQRFYLS